MLGQTESDIQCVLVMEAGPPPLLIRQLEIPFEVILGKAMEYIKC